MRRVVACLFLSLVFALPPAVAAVIPVPRAEPDVTVILNFKATWSPRVIDEMKKESSRILGTAGLRIGWSSPSEAVGQTFSSLVVMSFHGACTFPPAPPRYDELGPYGMTTTTDGEVQPFGEVDCDHVAGSVRAAMTEADYGRADLLVGRALGRVVAHELVHMLTHSTQHGREGVAKPALTGRQLIGASLPLSREDADRLRLELKLR